MNMRDVLLSLFLLAHAPSPARLSLEKAHFIGRTSFLVALAHGRRSLSKGTQRHCLMYTYRIIQLQGYLLWIQNGSIIKAVGHRHLPDDTAKT